MSIFYKPDGTFYISSPNQRTQELDVIDDEGLILYSLPSNQSPSDPNGNLLLFNNNGSSSFVPLSAISPNSPSSYGTFSADPNPDIPSNSTYKFLFNQTQDSPISNVIINQDNNIVIQEAGNYLFLIDTEGQTNAEGIDNICLIQVLNNGSVINQALVGENAYTNSINTTLFQSTVSCNIDDEISIIITTQDTATSVNIRNLTFTINYIPPLIDATTNSSYGTFQIANETAIPANLQYNFPLIQTVNSPLQSFTINAGNIQFQQAGNYLLILDTEGYVSNVLSTNAVFSITRNGVPINPALIATNTYSQRINTTVFQSLITVAENDIIRVVIATENTFGAIVNVRNLTVSVISLVIGGGGGGGNPNALITSDSIQTPTQGAIIIADGIDPFLCHPTSLLTIDNEGLRINDAGNSEYTTLSTSMGQTYLVNSGDGGMTLNGGSGDITLSSTKFQGVVNINTSFGLRFNDVGLITNDGNDLRVFNGDGNTSIESKQNNVFLRVGDNLKYENGLTTALYNIVPTAQPFNSSIIEYQANGDCAFIPTPSGGNPASLINTNYPSTPEGGSILYMTGADAVSAIPSNNTFVSSEGIRLFGSSLQIVSVVGCDSRISQDTNCDLNINNNSEGAIKLRCGDRLKLEGRTGVSYSFPSLSFSMPNQGDIISFNSDGTSEFISNGGGGGAVNAILNTAYPTTATAGSLVVMNGGDAISSSPSSLLTADANNLNLTSTLPTLNLYNTNLNSAWGYHYYSNDGNLIIDNQDNNQGTENKIIVGRVDTEITTAQTNGDILLRCGTGLIELNGGVNIVGGSASNNISKNGGNELLLNGENNIYLRSGGGSTFIQSTGGNINLDAPFGVIQCNSGALLVNGISNFNNDVNVINSSGLFIKDTVSNFQSNIQQQEDGNFRFLNENGSILLQAQKGVDIGSTSSVFISKISTDDIGDMLLENLSGNIDLKPSGRVKITRPSDPQLDFINNDHPTQQCNIVFESGSQELIMENFNPDVGAKCNIRLGVNDINIDTFVGPASSGDIHLRSGSGLTFINNYSLPNVNPTEDNQIMTFDINGDSRFINLTTNTYTYFVSSNGSNSNNGSINSPYLTIQYAIDVANSISDTTSVVINVMAGSYNENLTITRTNMSIMGANATSPNLTTINGTVSYNVVSSDPVNFPQVSSLSNFLITNTVSHENGTIYQNSLILNNCILLPLSNVAPLSTTNTGLGVLKADETLNNSFVYIFATPITIDSTNLTIANSQILNSPFISSTSSFVNVIGSGKVSGFGAIFRNSNVSAQVNPLVVIANSIDSTGDSTFNTCSFIYNSGTLDTTFGGKCGIRFANTGSCQTYIVTNCFFKCLGATTTTGSSNQFLIIQRTGTGQCSLALGANNACSGLNTHHTPTSGSGFTKIILVNAV